MDRLKYFEYGKVAALTVALITATVFAVLTGIKLPLIGAAFLLVAAAIQVAVVTVIIDRLRQLRRACFRADSAVGDEAKAVIEDFVLKLTHRLSAMVNKASWVWMIILAVIAIAFVLWTISVETRPEQAKMLALMTCFAWAVAQRIDYREAKVAQERADFITGS